MRLILGSLIVVLMAASYGIEAVGLPLILGVGPVRLLVLVLAAVWVLIEAVLMAKKLSSANEKLLQSQLVQDAARREAADARDEISKVQKDLASLRRMPQGEDAVQLLALLQQKGRFLDFVMDDVTKYPDAQIGAAARVVHQGCAHVVREYFDIQPVADGAEGGTVVLERNYDHHKFRLVGRVTGEAPYQGRIVHRGWLTASVRLPERVRAAADVKSYDVIAPAEIEVS